MKAPARILVRLPNWVGDVVMATPALRAIRMHWPKAHLVALVRDYAASLLNEHPRVDEVWSLSEREERGPRQAWKLGQRLKKGDFDLGILFTNSWTSALPFWLGRVRARVGYRGDLRSPLLTHPIPPLQKQVRKQPVPMPRLYQTVLDHLGIAAAGPEYELRATSAASDAVERKLRRFGVKDGAPLIGLNPGARFGASKLWPVEEFGALARQLHGAGFTPIVLGAANEIPLIHAVAAASGGLALATSSECFELAELPALCLRLRGFVTTDSGPRHIANWAGVPTVVVMGPTHPGWTDWNMETTRVLRRDVPCGPCHKKICPLDHRCLTMIPAQEAFAVLTALLASSAPAPTQTRF